MKPHPLVPYENTVEYIETIASVKEAKTQREEQENEKVRLKARKEKKKKERRD